MDGIARRISLLAASLAVAWSLAGPANAAPVAITINDLSASASPILSGTSTALTMDATDSGGALTYSWSASGGSISGSGAAVSWQAPNTSGDYTITCTVIGPSGNLGQTITVSVVSGPTQWASTPPGDCPFPKSTDIPGILFNRFASQHFCDTWYPSWGADDALYSPFMDGILLTPGFTQDVIGDANAVAVPARTGWAKLLGNDPMNLDVVDAGILQSPRDPYGGRYASASLHYNGVWYYGTYATMNELNSNDAFVTINGVDYNWGVLGPFVGFHTSTDNGHTWTAPSNTPSAPLFGEPATKGAKLKMGVPHVVDFGKNMQHSPDGKAYLICHGAVDPDPSPRLGNLSWITGDQIYMARVTPSLSTINDPSQYEFYAGNGTWSSQLANARPVIDWNNNVGGVTMTWCPPLSRYLTCIVDGRTTADNMNTYILESPTLTGPFKLITYMRDFGPQAYFCNFPSKFMTGDGKSAWMWYSANFHPLDRPNGGTPPGSGYHLCSIEVLVQRPVHSNPLSGGSPGTPPPSTPPPSTPPPSTPPVSAPPPAGPPRDKESKWTGNHLCGVGSSGAPGLTFPLILAGLLGLSLLVRRR